MVCKSAAGTQLNRIYTASCQMYPINRRINVLFTAESELSRPEEAVRDVQG